MKIQEHYQKLYGSNTVGGTTMSIWQKRTYSDLLKENLNNKKILEVGVGTNGLIFTLRNQFPDNTYYGVDLSEDVLRHIATLENIQGINRDLGSQKLDEIEANSIDIIIFNEVIEHIFDCQYALNEIFRILKKGGKLFISTHNTFNIFMRIYFLFGIIPNPSLDVSDENTRGEHIRIFNQNTLLKLIKNAGFSIVLDKSWSGTNKNTFKVSPWIANLLARHFYFICKK
ncbi:MAG: class I SAM-dependent methyltransferase [Candidatus Gracilibacteria bacterium]|nr:class I SAM-dependent methyltransferase [Candidatus Gracilibacteria bacterium]